MQWGEREAQTDRGISGGKKVQKKVGKEKMNLYCQMPAQQVVHELYV